MIPANNSCATPMYYTIYATDADNSLENRITARPAHVERLKALVEQGRLLASGPTPRLIPKTPAAQDLPAA